MSEAGLFDCGTPCIPVVPKPVIFYLLLWQLVEITEVVFPHELKGILSKCHCALMALHSPFVSRSVFGLSGAWAILRATASQLQDAKEMHTRTYVCLQWIDHAHFILEGTEQ